MSIYLNALGIVNPIGNDKEEVARSLFSGTRAGLSERSDLIPNRTLRAGVVRSDLPEIPDWLGYLDCRNNRLALAALRQIECEITDAKRRYGADRIAVVMGTSTSGIAEGETAVATRMAQGHWPPEFQYSQQEIGGLAEFVAEYFEISGPAYVIATACSSSGKVFASAARLLRAGICDAAVVGGTDTLCRLTLNGFAALEALAADYCNPFSRNRDGINIGEGAAIFLMTREPSSVSLLGVGESSDAHHISAPDPEGTGAIRAMRLALESAGLRPEQIDYVNLHGTATSLNDVMEGRAIASVFGGRVPCSSTKAMTGHMLGAAAAGEAGFLWLALHPEFSAGSVPPHLWDGEADPQIPPLHYSTVETRLDPRGRCAMLSNSFAFGGSNVALVLGRGW